MQSTVSSIDEPLVGPSQPSSARSPRSGARSLAPRPEELYEERTDAKYRELFDQSLEIYAKSFLFWKLKSENDSSKKISTLHADEFLRDVSWELWMVGRDRQHMHPTLLIFETENSEAAKEKLEALSSKSDLGYLILDVRPEFLEDRNVISSHEKIQVYAVREQISNGPASRVAVRSKTKDRWNLTTMGGFVEYDHQIYGLALAKPFEDRQTIQEIIDRGPDPSIKYSSFRPGQHLGQLWDSHDSSESEGWALVELDSTNTTQNMVQVPGGFGERFIVKPHAKTMSDGMVWIITGKGVVFAQGFATMEPTSRTEQKKAMGAHEAGDWNVLLTDNLGKYTHRPCYSSLY
jgi:hypothetical protein